MARESKKESKLPYEKPRLRTIQLAAEEVLAISCKTASGKPGKAGGRCGFQPCSNPGAYGS